MYSNDKAALLPVMLDSGARYVCNFLRFAGYYQDQEVYWCTLVSEEEPFNALPGPFALLISHPKQDTYQVISERAEIKEILQHLDTLDDIPYTQLKPCDFKILRYVVPVFRAVFPLKIHSKINENGKVFAIVNDLRTDLDKQVIHDSLAELFSIYVAIIRHCNSNAEYFLSQCDAYEKVNSGFVFARGPIAEMQQGGGIPFMDYNQASQWLDFASWQADSVLYESVDHNNLQLRLDFMLRLNQLVEQLINIGLPLLKTPEKCTQQYANFKLFAAYEFSFNDDIAFVS